MREGWQRRWWKGNWNSCIRREMERAWTPDMGKMTLQRVMAEGVGESRRGCRVPANDVTTAIMVSWANQPCPIPAQRSARIKRHNTSRRGGWGSRLLATDCYATVERSSVELGVWRSSVSSVEVRTGWQSQPWQMLVWSHLPRRGRAREEAAAEEQISNINKDQDQESR